MLAGYSTYTYDEYVYEMQETIVIRGDFTFTLTQTSDVEHGVLAQLKITNTQTGEIIQVIDDIEIAPSVIWDGFGLIIEDANFDGFYDIIINIDRVGNQAALISRCWLWNDESQQFEESQSFPGFNAIIDTNEQVIRTTSRGSAVHRVWYIYRFIDGEFVMTNSMERDMPWDMPFGHSDARRWRFKERTLINGIWHENVTYFDDVDDGYIPMEEHPMFQPDSIWNPNRENVTFTGTVYGNIYN